MLLCEIINISLEMKKKKIVSALASYVTDNNKYQFNWAYMQAMQLYPQFHYTGKMYRAILIHGSEKMSTSQLVQAIRDYPQDVQSFTKSLEYTQIDNNDKSIYDIYGKKVVIQQFATGLDIISLLTHEFQSLWGKEYYNEFPEQEEVLSFLNKNTLKIIYRMQ